MPHRTRATPEIPTASMADVAFLLLVFFLLVTAFRSEQGLRTDLPAADSPPARVSATMTVLVGPTGDLAVDGERTSAEAVRTRVAAFAGSGVVLLKSDRDAPYSAYIAALDAVLLGHQDAGLPPRLALSQRGD
ncbi:MAG: biopolymer transporter ExbD [Bacteroidota bacterium]